MTQNQENLLHMAVGLTSECDREADEYENCPSLKQLTRWLRKDGWSVVYKTHATCPDCVKKP